MLDEIVKTPQNDHIIPLEGRPLNRSRFKIKIMKLFQNVK